MSLRREALLALAVAREAADVVMRVYAEPFDVEPQKRHARHDRWQRHEDGKPGTWITHPDPRFLRSRRAVACGS